MKVRRTPEEAGVDEGSRPLADPQDAVVCGVRADARPGLGDGHRACGGEVAAQFAVAFEGTSDDGVVRRAQDDGEVAGLQPACRCEVGCTERGGHREHLLAQYGRGPSVAATGIADRTPRGFMSGEIETVLA